MINGDGLMLMMPMLTRYGDWITCGSVCSNLRRQLQRLHDGESLGWQVQEHVGCGPTYTLSRQSEVTCRVAIPRRYSQASGW